MRAYIHTHSIWPTHMRSASQCLLLHTIIRTQKVKRNSSWRSKLQLLQLKMMLLTLLGIGCRRCSAGHGREDFVVERGSHLQ